MSKTKEELQKIIYDLNNSSNDCLMAVDELKIMELEEKIIQLKDQNNNLFDIINMAMIQCNIKQDTDLYCLIMEARRNRVL